MIGSSRRCQPPWARLQRNAGPSAISFRVPRIKPTAADARHDVSHFNLSFGRLRIGLFGAVGPPASLAAQSIRGMTALNVRGSYYYRWNIFAKSRFVPNRLTLSSNYDLGSAYTSSFPPRAIFQNSFNADLARWGMQFDLSAVMMALLSAFLSIFQNVSCHRKHVQLL